VGSNPTFSATEDKASSQDEAYFNKEEGGIRTGGRSGSTMA
jgi:hypothetical protein